MGGFIVSKLDGPYSTGELKLRSRNPTDIPSVKFNYFEDTRDLEKCVNGVSTILTAIESRAFSKFKYANMTAQDILELNVKLPTYLPTHANTSLSLEQFCKDTVRTVWQFHGGCQIGKVVDDDYKVIGVDNLRIIDGSTLLKAPANLLMVGRYMGLTIQAQRQESEESKSGLLFTS